MIFPFRSHPTRLFLYHSILQRFFIFSHYGIGMKIEQLEVDGQIKNVLAEMGIKELYPPQAEAIPYVLKGENVVMAVPTAAGKSLVAYLGAVKAALEGKKSVYMVPLRALAREKYEDLLVFEKIGVRVGISTGDLEGSGEHLSRYDIIVCTNEKADSLLRHGAGWLNQVKVVIADEIHLINDASRGPTMEVNLAKFMLMEGMQIIGLSATIKNAKEMAEWLDAILIESDWRPVPLKEGVLFGKKIYFLDGTSKEIKKASVSGLVEDVLEGNGQALVFVNTRRSAQSTAEKLKDVCCQYLDGVEEELKKLAEEMRREEGNMVAKRLAACIEKGVAFHHAGLDNRMRKYVEDNFRKGMIKCIVATPTLAAGVNTPARRVVINNLWRYSQAEGYMQPIPVMEIKQMMGRAGRPGYDEEGEAILIAKNKMEKERLWNDYLMADVEPVFSKLASEPALRMHLLAIIATGFAISWDEINEFLRKTFYVHTLGIIPREKLWEILDFLERNEFIESKGEKWRATLFGYKTMTLYIDPLSALIMREALKEKRGDEFSYLHAICATPDMRCLYLGRKDEWVEEKAKEEKFLLSPPSIYNGDYDFFLSEVKTASLLEDWINERKEDEMIVKYQVGPGDIHARVETAEWLLHAMQELARLFNFDAVSFLSKLKLRVKYGCREELLNLVTLRGIGRVRARILYRNGFRSIDMLRRASVERLASLPGIGMAIAKQIKEQVG